MQNDHHCPVCESSDQISFLRRSKVPAHQNMVVRSFGEARSVSRGELELMACRNCGFVHNQLFDFVRMSYDAEYDNTQSSSGYFDAYMDSLVEHLVVECGISNCTVVEVGCGKGLFLKKLIEFSGANIRGVGFDPTYVGPDSLYDGRLTFHRQFYDASCKTIRADAVICRHVIEHVQKPMELLVSVRGALLGSSHARVFFETPCVEWILSNQVIWDFFYEHCSLFTAYSLCLAFTKAGFHVDKVKHVFGGQYLWIEAGATNRGNSSEAQMQATAGLATSYGNAESHLKAKWKKGLQSLKQEAGVAIWGAGAKGATLANLLDSDCILFDCVVDINTNKQGKFIPGTGHLIIGPSDLAARGVKIVILMNPNYRAEVIGMLSHMAPDVRVVSLEEL